MTKLTLTWKGRPIRLTGRKLTCCSPDDRTCGLHGMVHVQCLDGDRLALWVYPKHIKRNERPSKRLSLKKRGRLRLPR